MRHLSQVLFDPDEGKIGRQPRRDGQDGGRGKSGIKAGADAAAAPNLRMPGRNIEGRAAGYRRGSLNTIKFQRNHFTPTPGNYILSNEVFLHR